MNRCKQRILAILAVVGLILLLPGLAQATSWTVNPGGGGDYTTIQAAINAATTSPGDTINVLAGTYNEMVNVTKPLSIIGGAGVVEIDVASFYGSASGNNTGIAVLANNVTISGFTVTFNNPDGGVGIGLFSGASDCTITDNVISEFRWGIQQYGLDGQPASGNSIVGNTLYGNGYGIELFNAGIDGTLVAGNTLYDNIGGIAIVTDSLGSITNVTVQGNTLYDNSYAILVDDPTWLGIGVLDSIAITKNFMTNNDTGVYLTSYVPDASGVSVNYNNIVSTSGWGVYNVSTAGTLDATHNWWGSAAGPYVYDANYSYVGGVGGPGATVIYHSGNVDYDPWLSAPIPEPATLLLLVTGLTGIPLLRRRWKRQ